MPTKLEILQAIAELQSKEPTYSTCEKLATFYTLLRFLYSEEDVGIKSEPIIIFPEMNGSEFKEAISGKQVNKVVDVLNEHMQVAQLLFPKEYNAVITKIGEIQ